MGLSYEQWLLIGSVLGVYVIVFGFVRRVNELWSLVKLGKKVYGALPPGDMGWPFVGTSLAFLRAFTQGGDPDSFINRFVSRHGRIGMYKTHLYGNPTIIVTDAEICRRVYFMDDDEMKQYSPPSVKILEGNGSITGMNQKQVHRLVAAPINGSEALCRYIGYIENLVVNSLEEWSSMKSVEVLTQIKSITFKVIINVFMGSITDSQMLQLGKMYNQLSAGVLSVVPMGSAIRRAIQARKEITNILESIIKEKRREWENNKDKEAKCQMHVLMEATDENGKKMFSDSSIGDLLIGLLYAGHDTTSHAAMSTLVHLSDHPQVLHKAKAEQELIMKYRPPTQEGITYKEIREMKYLAKVINETLRTPTIAALNFRQAISDVNINGYIIPRGWIVAIWIKAVHNDPEIYSNPQEFDPSRWDNFKPKAGSFIPFGLGNRYCPGSEFAKLEITILLHHFLLNYKIERVNPKCPRTYIPSPKPIDNCLSRIIKVNDGLKKERY